MANKSSRAFTLIEMLIVIAIVAVLIAVSVPMIIGAVEDARIRTDEANEKIAWDLASVSYMTKGTLITDSDLSASSVSSIMEVGGKTARGLAADSYAAGVNLSSSGIAEAGAQPDAIFDAAAGRWVDPGSTVQPYGKCKDHQGGIITGYISDATGLTLGWYDPGKSAAMGVESHDAKIGAGFSAVGGGSGSGSGGLGTGSGGSGSGSGSSGSGTGGGGATNPPGGGGSESGEDTESPSSTIPTDLRVAVGHVSSVDYGYYNVKLTWKPAVEAINYDVQVSSDGINWEMKQIAASDTSYELFYPYPKRGEKRYFRVRVNSPKIGEWSDVAEATAETEVNIDGIYYNIDEITGKALIGDNTGERCSSISTLNIPDSVTVDGKTYPVYGFALPAVSSPFRGNNTITEIKYISRNITDFYSAFFQMNGLKKVSSGAIGSGKITNAWNMFGFCRALTDIDVSGWDVGDANNMSNMFQYCSSLKSLDVSNWDTSKATNMSSMFFMCSSLSSLDMSGWDTRQATKMRNMLYFCSSLSDFKIGENFKFEQAGDLSDSGLSNPIAANAHKNVIAALKGASPDPPAPSVESLTSGYVCMSCDDNNNTTFMATLGSSCPTCGNNLFMNTYDVGAVVNTNGYYYGVFTGWGMVYPIITDGTAYSGPEYVNYNGEQYLVCGTIRHIYG